MDKIPVNFYMVGNMTVETKDIKTVQVRNT